MKHLRPLAFGAAFLFAFLFYHQDIGFNVPVFALVLLGLLLAKQQFRIQRGQWLPIAGLLISACSAAYKGNFSGSFLVFTSLFWLGFTTTGRFSAAFIVPHTVYSWFASLPPLLRSGKQPENSTEPENRGLAAIVAILVSAVFLVVYMAGNAAYSRFVKDLGRQWLNFDLVGMLVVGIICCAALLLPRAIPGLRSYEDRLRDHIPSEERGYDFGVLGGYIDRIHLGRMLFLILNVLLLSVNAYDIAVFSGAAHTDSASLAAEMHQSVFNIFLSAALAIALVLSLFGGNVRFDGRARAVKQLVMAWIVQNIVLLTLSTLKNINYIDAYGLTQKRLGVFLYLAICIAGLAILLVQQARGLTVWFVVRQCLAAGYALFTIYMLVNWEGIITESNLRRALVPKANVDVRYLLGLPNNELELYRYGRLLNKKPNSTFEEDEYAQFIEVRLEDFMSHHPGWRSQTVIGNANRRALSETFAEYRHERLKWRQWNELRTLWYDQIRLYMLRVQSAPSSTTPAPAQP